MARDSHVANAGVQNLSKVVQEFPTPKNCTDIKAFISLAGFYRRHVQAFDRH